MRSTDAGEIAHVMNNLADELGDYVLYTSEGEIFVVAAKRGQMLPAPSGEALRGISDDSFVKLSGFRDEDHISSHALGGRSVFSPYFRSMAHRNRVPTDGRPTGSLFRADGFSLLSHLDDLEFPLLAVLEGRILPEPSIVAENRRYTWETLRYAYALSLFQHLIEGKWSRERFKNSDVVRLEKVMTAADCPVDTSGWLSLVGEMRYAMRLLNPYLNPDRMSQIWEEIDRGCLGGLLPAEAAPFVDYYRALSRRDFVGVLTHGKLIYESGGGESGMGNTLFSSIIVAYQKEGKKIEAAETLSNILPYVGWGGAELTRFIGAQLFESQDGLERGNGGDEGRS